MVIHGSEYTSNVLDEPIVVNKVIKTIVYKLTNLILNINATFEIMFYDENDVLFKTTYYGVTGDDYKNWTNDDGYIFELIKRDLNTLI
jgi:hypothetical protein